MVIETDDLHIVRYAPAFLLQDLVGPHGHSVGSAEDPVDAGICCQECLHGRSAGRVAVVTVPQERRIERRAERHLETLEPRLAAGCVLRTRDHGDAPGTGLEQMFARQPGAGRVVHGHGSHQWARRVHTKAPAHRDGKLGGDDLVEQRIGHVRSEMHDTIDPALVQKRRRPSTFEVTAREQKDQGIRAVPEPLRHALDELSHRRVVEEFVGGLCQEHCDGVVPARRQGARMGIQPVAGRPDRAHHRIPRLGRDMGRTGEHTAHRAARDAGLFGDVLDRRGHMDDPIMKPKVALVGHS